MARLAGASLVGMSTVPEIILGRFFGLRCAAASTVVNFAAGMTGAELSHEETKALAPIGAQKLERIVRRYLRDRAGLGPELSELALRCGRRPMFSDDSNDRLDV